MEKFTSKIESASSSEVSEPEENFDNKYTSPEEDKEELENEEDENIEKHERLNGGDIGEKVKKQ